MEVARFVYSLNVALPMAQPLKFSDGHLLPHITNLWLTCANITEYTMHGSVSFVSKVH